MSLDIPGYTVGTWSIDTAHTEVGFSIRHLMISKVKGVFEKFSGTITTPEDPSSSSVTATVEVESINTKNSDRDGHLLSSDFFLAGEHPTMDFTSTGLRHDGDQFLVDGDLTLRGVTKPVTFTFEFGGFGSDSSGNTIAAGTATTTITRNDFGLSWNAPLETGGIVLGDDVNITVEFEAVLNAA